MIASVEPLNAGFAISDPDDPRAVYFTALRERFGKFLHEASTSFRQQGEENTVDAVSMLVGGSNYDRPVGSPVVTRSNQSRRICLTMATAKTSKPLAAYNDADTEVTLLATTYSLIAITRS